MKDRERLALLTVASDVRGDIEDDFDEMCFGEPPSVAACIDEPNDPWHMNWNVTFRDAFFLSKDSDGSFQLKCVYNMNENLAESEGIILSLLGPEETIMEEVDAPVVSEPDPDCPDYVEPDSNNANEAGSSGVAAESETTNSAATFVSSSVGLLLIASIIWY